MIDGVVISPLKVISDERGKVMHMLRSDQSVFKKFDDWSEKNATLKIEACLGFVKKFDFIDKFIIGFENINQLDSANKYFSKSKLKFPKHIFSNEKKLINPSLWKNE